MHPHIHGKVTGIHAVIENHGIATPGNHIGHRFRERRKTPIEPAQENRRHITGGIVERLNLLQFLPVQA